MISGKIPSIVIGKTHVYLVEGKDLVEFKSIKDLTKNISQGQVNLILSADTGYLKFFSFPIETIVDKTKIELELQKQIPLDLSKVDWQYKLISKNKKTQEYWAFAPETNSLNPFVETLKKNGLEVNSLSSLPFLISENIPKYKNPTLVIFQKKKIQFILIIAKNKIWLYNLPADSDLKTVVASLIELAKNHHKLEIKNLTAISDQDLSNLKLKMEKVNFDFSKVKFIPLIEDYEIKSEKKKNKKTDDLAGEEKNDESENENTKTKFKFFSKRSLGLILILGASIILMLATFWLKKPGAKQNLAQQPEQSETSLTPKEIDENNPLAAISTPEPSPSPKFFSNLYSVQILNGSGTAGLASQTQILLEENDFNDLETGNADNNDYETTEIITDDEDLKKELTKILEKDFQINPNPNDTSIPEDFDAIIILGQN
jgi:hypothetical protein